jgi:hypothetical protein
MKNVIQVLAHMGESANLQSPEVAAEFVNQSELSAELQTALLEQDVTTLERNLDVCPDIVCIIMAPEDDEPSEDDEEQSAPKENAVLKVAINT